MKILKINIESQENNNKKPIELNECIICHIFFNPVNKYENLCNNHKRKCPICDGIVIFLQKSNTYVCIECGTIQN